MRKITILLLVLSFSVYSFAQITIKGVVSYDSIPLEYASVIIKNTKKGVATSEKGQFKIEAIKGDTLSVSYLGYETKEIVVNKNENLNIALEVGNNLEEVVVLAYGTTTRRFSKGCCCWVTTEEEERLMSNKEKRLKNKLYPNPSSNGVFQLKLNENYNEVKISIANMSGQIIQNSIHQKNGEKLNIDLSQYSTGIYIINIIADGKSLKAIKAVRS